jgi:hypothetical protein
LADIINVNTDGEQPLGAAENVFCHALEYPPDGVIDVSE